MKSVDFIEVVLTEMGKGNFSFLILVVGILQLIVMIKRNKNEKTGGM